MLLVVCVVHVAPKTRMSVAAARPGAGSWISSSERGIPDGYMSETTRTRAADVIRLASRLQEPALAAKAILSDTQLPFIVSFV